MVNDFDENYKTGYIKIYRSLKKHWLWGNDKKSKFEAWIDMLLMASHTGLKEPIGYDLVTVEQGQILTSQEKLSISWRWDRQAVRRFLEMLERDGMINISTTSKFTMITICKYDSYQNKKPTKHHQDTSVTPALHQRYTTINNENNDNNVNNVFSAEQKEQFSRFEAWCIANAITVTKMVEPINIEQFFKLIEKHDKVLVMDNLVKMHNHTPLLKKNRSAYLTVLNWISRDQQNK